MWLFTKLADWWDEKKKETSEYLHEFVDEQPHWWAIAIAGSVETSMRLGAGFVDVLRLGDGIKEGTWRGVVHDGLRLLAIAGPVAKVGRGIARFVVPDAGGNVCAWVSATQALRQTGVQHFATIDDLVIATGRTPGPASMPVLEDILRASGAEVTRLPKPANMLAVKELAAANPNGVVMFGIKWSRLLPENGKIVEKVYEHALYAYRNILGKVKIIDRTGKSVEMLTELEPGVKPGYPGITQAYPTNATFIKNATAVTLVNGAAAIAVETRAVMLASRKTADASYARFKALRDAGYDAKTAARPDTFPAPAKKGVAPHARHTGASNRPSSPPAPVRPSAGHGTPVAHVVHTVKPGETWESVLRPFWEPKSGIPFADFIGIEKATNRLMGHAPMRGELTPGLQIWIY